MKCCDCGNTHHALPGFPNQVLCDYYHLHMSNSADASRCEHFKPKPQTNADRIRSMTDEELAEWVWGAESSGRAYGVRGKNAWLKWLKAPVEEVDND